MIAALCRRVRRRERGSALVEFVTLGILFIIPLMWFVLALFDVQRSLYGVTAAAREAGRAYVLSSNAQEGEQRAREAASISLGDQDIELGGPDGADVDVDCESANGDVSDTACLEAGSYALVTVSYKVNLFYLPDFFDEIKPTYPVKAVHRTPYGEYRESR